MFPSSTISLSEQERAWQGQDRLTKATSVVQVALRLLLPDPAPPLPLSAGARRTRLRPRGKAQPQAGHTAAWPWGLALGQAQGQRVSRDLLGAVLGEARGVWPAELLGIMCISNKGRWF